MAGSNNLELCLTTERCGHCTTGQAEIDPDRIERFLSAVHRGKPARSLTRAEVSRPPKMTLH